jgi:uncharacterized NAD-dependent epimerase/dehydratase family protein
VLAAGEGLTANDWLLVEGQGSLCHPGSTATLPLMRGSQPTDLLLVHRAGQRHSRGLPELLLPPLPQLIQALEALAALARPSTAQPPPRVRAVALNTALLEEAAAQNAIAEVSELTGLPCTDPVRYGAGPLLEELLA